MRIKMNVIIIINESLSKSFHIRNDASICRPSENPVPFTIIVMLNDLYKMHININHTHYKVLYIVDNNGNDYVHTLYISSKSTISCEKPIPFMET